MLNTQKHKITVTVQEGLVQIAVISSVMRKMNNEETLTTVTNEKKFLEIKDGMVLLNDLFTKRMVEKIAEMIEQNTESL